jgi:hypothetical protein
VRPSTEKLSREPSLLETRAADLAEVCHATMVLYERNKRVVDLGCSGRYHKLDGLSSHQVAGDRTTNNEAMPAERHRAIITRLQPICLHDFRELTKRILVEHGFRHPGRE